MTRKILPRISLLALMVAVLAACTTYRATRRATEAVRLENWDAAVYYYLEALAEDPGNVKYKMELQRARLKAGEQHFRQGMRFREINELQRAEAEFELAVELDSTHQYAQIELAKVREDLEVLAHTGGAAKLEAIKKAASEMKVKPPVLNPASNEPMSLSFPNPTNIKDIYKALGGAFGINILFDPRLKDNKITIELKEVTARSALETVMQAGGHFYKVLDEKTVIVIEDTPQNRRDYEDLVVKTFFLSNADVKDVNNTLRALIDARRLSINEQLNSIVIRDTADKVAIAERLIAANDKAKAEVLVDVELIQVDSSRIRDIGIGLSSYTYPVTFDPTGITGAATKTTIPLNRLADITRSMWGVVVPNLTLSLVKSAGEAETLAQPQLRITEGEKANLVIGDRVPIPTTTFNTTQTVGGNIVPITAFQYQDVGIKIEVEPRVHHNNEVTLKIQVEVSELGESVDVGGGNKQPKIGTRTINSTIRLKDGETSLLAGLFKYNRRESHSGIPWLSDLPLVGSLFRANSSDFKKTDLILTLTPHIVRNPDITEEDLAPLWVGTENRITIFGNSPRVRSPATGNPFGEGAPDIFGGSFEGTAGGGAAVEPEPEPTPAPAPSQPSPADKMRLIFPPPQGRSVPTPTPAPEGKDNPPDAPTAPAPSDSLAGEASLAKLSFYPNRLPLALGGKGQLVVYLDPGTEEVGGPLNLAYDPARLKVTRVEGGEVTGAGGKVKVQATHTPALGWITVSWSGKIVGSGPLVYLEVSPLVAGELPIVFAGPIGEVVAQPATIVGLPAPGGRSIEVQEP